MDQGDLRLRYDDAEADASAEIQACFSRIHTYSVLLAK
jgi:hypothetical protein